MRLKVAVRHEPAILGTIVYLYGEDEQGDFYIDTVPLVKKYLDDETLNIEPTFKLDRGCGTGFLQSFANALMEFGFMPDELKAKGGEVAAIKYHLEDMRKLVFKHGNKED